MFNLIVDISVKINNLFIDKSDDKTIYIDSLKLSTFNKVCSFTDNPNIEMDVTSYMVPISTNFKQSISEINTNIDTADAIFRTKYQKYKSKYLKLKRKINLI